MHHQEGLSSEKLEISLIFIVSRFISVVSRLCNSSAHKLAKLGLEGMAEQPCVWLSPFPPHLMDLMSADHPDLPAG